MLHEVLHIAHSFRLPGLGLLVVPAAPVPAWLATPPLHSALALRLHREGQVSLALTATIEELDRANEPLTRALLLDADPPGELTTSTWIELVGKVWSDLL